MITLIVDGIPYQYPQSDDEDWGNQATLWASSVSDVVSSLRSPTLPTADAGKVRLGNTDRFSWRGFANTFNVDLYVDVDDKLYVKIGANPPIDLTSAAAGNVTGPLTSTDEAVARYNGGTGQVIQDSVVLISDLGATSGITSLAISGALSGVTTLSMSGALSGATDITGSATVTGADLHATDDLTVDDDATITGDLVAGTLAVTGATLLNGNVTIGNAAGDTVTITAATSSSVSGNFADAVGTAMTATGANEVIDAYTRSTGTSVGARGVAISSGITATRSNSVYADVTNATVTITTSGRPVVLTLIAQSTGVAYIGVDKAGAGSVSQISATFNIIRTASILAEFTYWKGFPATTDTNPSVRVGPGSLLYIDPVAAGTYTYKMQFKTLNTNSTATIQQCSFVAYEL